MTHTDLIQRLESATGPDRELDALIYCAVEGYTFIKFTSRPAFKSLTYRSPGDPSENYEDDYPAFTASLDAITSLIEREFPGCYIEIEMGNPPMDRPTKGRIYERTSRGTSQIGQYYGKTPALNLCIAVIRALQARGQANG